MRRTIAFDLDDTLSHNVEKVVRIYNEETGEQLTYNDITKWCIEDLVKPEHRELIRTIFDRTGWFRYIEPRKDMIAAMKELSINNDIIVVSAYHASSCVDKHAWFREYIPFLDPAALMFCCKKQYIHCSFLVDDGLHNLETTRGVPIVVDRPWNKTPASYAENGRYIHRVTDGQSLVDLISRLTYDTGYRDIP